MEHSVDWEDIVSRWESSGVSQRKFCIEHAVVPSQLSYWKRKLRPESKQKPNFKRVLTANSGCRFEVVSSSGARVLVPMGFESESLKRLLEVLK